MLCRALDQTRYRIREAYGEAFFSRGKHHGLAGRGRIGWHPGFEERVEKRREAAGIVTGPTPCGRRGGPAGPDLDGVRKNAGVLGGAGVLPSAAGGGQGPLGCGGPGGRRGEG
ncbi:ABC-three component system protein [Streptomyces viridosporus]